MDEFEAIASALTTDAFANLTKAVESLGETGRQEYADRFPNPIWTKAGMNEDLSFAISAN